MSATTVMTDAPRSAMQREIGDVTQAYLRQARVLSYRQLRKNQGAPWANIIFGAPGIAAALARSGWDRRSARDLAMARRWITSATRGSRDLGAFTRAAEPGEPPPAVVESDPSLYFGPDGVLFLRLLLGPGGTRRRPSERVLRAFLHRCRECRRGPSELLEGVAGTLTALVLLHRRTGEPRALNVADELAADLLERAGGPEGWSRAPVLGLAHGRAGSFHALLGWANAAKHELPSTFFDDLGRLAADVDREGNMGAPRYEDPVASAVLAGSWCNGAAGLVLLWARAYEHTGNSVWLRHARRAARSLLTRTRYAPGDLCCGLGGRAYAFLAMDRVEPGRGWDDLALAMGRRAISRLSRDSSQWPNGLFKGYPGLVFLARDLFRAPAERIGFPLVEGV